MNIKHSCLISSSSTHRTRPLLQQTGMPRQLCPTADAQLHAAANAAATSCDHHGGIHFELGIDPEASRSVQSHITGNCHHYEAATLLVIMLAGQFGMHTISPEHPMMQGSTSRLHQLCTLGLQQRIVEAVRGLKRSPSSLCSMFCCFFLLSPTLSQQRAAI